MANNIRRALHKSIIHKPLTTVIAPSAVATRQEFNQKVELEQACLEEAGRHFTKVRDTPLLTSPLLETFGECGKSKVMAQVLGKFTPPPNCDKYAEKFLLAVSCPQTISNIGPRLLTSYCQSWQKTRESTSSSASGIHFGHYIARTFNPEILVMNVTIADIPLQTGFLYERWKTGLNIMIEKTMGDFNVKKL